MQRATIARVNIATIDVRAHGKFIANVSPTSGVNIEEVGIGDVVLIEEVDSKWYVIAVVSTGSSNPDDRMAEWVPRAPVSLMSFQLAPNFTLSWDWGDTVRRLQYLDHYEVDFKPAGGDWGTGEFPLDVGRAKTATVYMSSYGETSFSWRVRSVSIFGAASEWAEATATYILDTDAPPKPELFSTTDLPGKIRVEWSGPLAANVPDLAGFRIYEADDASGTNAEIYLEVGVVYSYDIELSAPNGMFIGLKAVDSSGNESDYALNSSGLEWDYGQSVYENAGNFLTNSDFERDIDGGGTPDGWTITNLTLGTNGYQGGSGLRYSGSSGSGDATWPSATSDTSIEVPFTSGVPFIVSAKIKCTDTDWVWAHSDTVVTGKMNIGFVVEYYGGTTSFTGYSMYPAYAGSVDLDDGWQLIWATVKAPITNDHFVGFGIQYYNDSGASVTLDIDHCQLEYGVDGGEPTQWTPNLSRQDSTSGLLMDTAAIIGSGILVTPDGEVIADSVEIGSPSTGPSSTDLAVEGDVRYEGDLTVRRDGDDYSAVVILNKGFEALTGDLTLTTAAQDAFSKTVTVPGGATLRIRALVSMACSAYTTAQNVSVQLYIDNTYQHTVPTTFRNSGDWKSTAPCLHYTPATEESVTFKLRGWKSSSSNTVRIEQDYTKIEWDIIG